MQEYMPNLWAVLGAVAAKFILGGLWYSPILFLKPWMKSTGIKEKEMKKGMPKAMVAEVVGGFLMAVVLAHAIHYAQAQGVVQGMVVGFFNWLGFVAVVLTGGVFYEKKPWNWYWITAGYFLVSLLIMGAILVTWA
jgi:hypothetical protein